MSTSTVKKLSIATATAALTAGMLGAGTASAQELSSNPDLANQFAQMSSALFGGGQQEQTGLIQSLPEGARPLTAPEASRLNGKLVAQKNDLVSLDFRSQPSARGHLLIADGCNSGTANYFFEHDNRLTITEILLTKRACDPPTTADSDALLQVLRSHPFLYRIDDTTYAVGADPEHAIIFDLHPYQH